MSTKDQSDLAKLEARIATQRRRLDRLLVSGSDPDGAADAGRVLLEMQEAVLRLSAKIGRAPLSPSSFRSADEGRALMTGETVLLASADDDGVAADGHGSAELVKIPAAGGCQFRPLRPGRAAARKDVSRALIGVTADIILVTSDDNGVAADSYRIAK